MQTCVVDNLYLARTKPVCVNEQRAHGPAMHILSGAQSMGVVTMANKNTLFVTLVGHINGFKAQ